MVELTAKSLAPKSAAAVAGVPVSVAHENPYDLASTLLGKGEIPDHAVIKDYLKNGGVNLDPATTAWCAGYVNATLAQSGYKGTGSNLARSFLNYGESVDKPQKGDIAVFSRGNNPTFGHVGFYDSTNPDGTIRILAGNQGNAVSYGNMPADRLLGFRRPPQEEDSGDALALTAQPRQSDAASAVNAMADGTIGGAPVHKVKSIGLVPPPFSGQQGTFEPLINDGQPQQPVAQAPQGEPGPVEQQPLAPPSKDESDDDILKAFLPAGADTTPVGQASQKPQEESDDDILKSFLPAEAPAADLKTSQAAAPSTVGQSIGSAIDTGVAAVSPYLARAGEAATAIGSFGNNLVRQVGTGAPVIGGALNSMDAATNALIAPAINPMLSDGNKLKGDTWSERYANSLAQQNGQDTTFEKDHPVISTGAQIAGGIGSMGGLAAKVPMVGKALGMTGNTLARTAAGIGSGIALGGADAGVRSGGDLGSIGQGAALGAVFGGSAPVVGKALGAAGNKLVGSAIPTRVAELAQLASDRYGISIGPGQLSTNPTIRFLDSVVNKIPFSGGTAAKETQQTAFNKAVASTIGENASELTPEVLGNAKTRIGKVFDSVAERTPEIRGDNEFVSGFQGILNEAKQTIAESELGPLQKQADNILGKFGEGNGSITGETYQALTRKGAPLDRAMASNDPNIRFYAGQMREALDGALQKSASPEVLADLKQARSQWKAMKTVEDLAEKAPTGDVSPALLMGAARKSYTNMAYGGDNDLVNLARIGQQFMKEPPSSGTAERSSLINLLAGGAGGGGVVSMAANPSSIPYVLGPVAGAAVLGRGVGTVLRSPSLGNRMVQGALNAGKNVPPTTSQLLLRATGQGSDPQFNRLLPPVNVPVVPKQPLEITVRRKN